MKKLKIFLLAMATFALAGNVALAQDRLTVNGTVTDETGEPLEGVVVTSASRQSAATDANGRFTLSARQGEDVTFSYLGYVTQTLHAQPTLNVPLQPDVVSLESVTVVAVGYGTARRADLTGAISSVQAKDFKQGIISSTEQLLQGKVAGLTVIRNGGNPTESAAMRLRGGTSLSASNAPLIVVDGIPGVDINTVQPGEVLSIDVLKDASAAAIYGSRGANGVIIITTNREQKGRTMEYNGYVAVGFAKNLDILSADEWRDYYRVHNPSALTTSDYGASTDWQKELEQTAITHSHTVSFTQGSENSGLRVSATYLNTQGVMKNSNLERFNGSLTGHQYGLNKRLRLEASLHATIDKTDDVDAGLLRTAYRINPTIPVYQPDGSYTNNPDITGTNASNVVESQNARNDEGTRKRLFAYGKGELEIISGLKAIANMSYEYNSAQDYYYEPSGVGYRPSTSNLAKRKLEDYTRKQIETYLTYDKVFAEKHRVGLMVGYSYMDHMTEGFGAERSGFDTNFFLWNNLGAGTESKVSDVSSYKRSAQLASVFARANYSFNSRYMLTATIRRDGSSRFGENHKWGTFPSVSAAWRISEESFMEGTKGWLDNLKLRAGYGVTGNQAGIDEYASLPTIGISSGSQYYDVVSGTWKNSYGFTRNANPDLKWESTAQTDIGVDFVLFNKVNVTFDWYYKKTSDLLYTYQVPTPPFLYSTILANVGDLSNRGVELTLGANIVRTNDFTFDANLTLAHNKQTVDKLSNDLYQTGNIYSGSLQGLQGLDVRTQVIAEGYPVGTFIGLRSGGIVNGKFDVPRDSNDKPLTTFQDEEAYVVLGNAQPDLTMGLALNLTYRQFDFSVAAYGMFGQKVLNGIATELSGKTWSGDGVYNFTKKFADSGLTEEANQVWCDYWLENASYLRLQTVTLGYTFPKNTFTKKIGIERLRLYITGENLFTFTGYTGLDPEVSIEGLSQPGIDKGNIYPMPRTVSFGVNFSF
jgi:iron complex outermembrane receptor protein